MSLSAAARQTVGVFAAQMNLTTEPTADGSHAFTFERSGTLNFTAAAPGGRILISLARHLALLNEESERRLLSIAGPDASDGRFLHAGMTAGGLVILAMSVEDTDFDLPRIEICIRRLIAAQTAFP